LVLAAQERGIAIQAHTRPLSEPAATDWPPVAVALTIAVEDVAEWLSAVEPAVELAQALHGSGSPATLIVPTIGGCTLRTCAIALITSTFPGQELFDSWQGLLPATAKSPITDLVTRCDQRLQELSAAQELAAARPSSHAVLAEQISRARADADEALAQLARRFDIAVVGELADSLRQVRDDVNNEPRQPSGVPTYAAEVAAGLAGQLTPSFQLLSLRTIIAVQADINPETAERLLAEFVSN
jgi:hypothetical protein